jgi:(1->4)-alpha-D-glucan 1-alpha-D-glucosylmutase
VLGDEAAILVAGRCFAALTDGGRRWPRAEAWKAQVMLDDLKPVDGAERTLALSRLFEDVPVAVLSAVRTSALSTASAG